MLIKRIIIVSLLIISALIAGFIFWQNRPGLPIAEILPEDVIVYANLTHADQHLKQIKTSPFAKEVAEIDIPKVMLKNGYSQEKINQIKQWQGQVKELAANPLLEKLIGQEIAISFFPQPIFILRLKPSLAAAKFVVQFSKAWGDGVELSHSSHQGIKIQHIFIKEKNLRISYLFLGDLFVASLDSIKQLQQVIDVYQKKLKSLSSTKHFNDVLGRAYSQAEGFVYINMPQVLVQLKKQIALWLGDKAEDGFEVGDFLRQMKGVDAYGLSFLPGEFFSYKFIAAVNDKEMTPESRRFLSCPKEDNKSISFIPANALGYYWGNCFDLTQLGDFWDMAGSFKEKIESRFSVDINKDLWPALSGEAGGYLTDIDARAIFPFPRGLIFVKIENKEAIERFLGKVTANSMVALKEEQYGKVNIRYMPLPLGANMDPGYAFLDDYLLMASSRQLLKKSLDIKDEANRSLAQDKVFKQFGLNQGEKVSSLSFMKIGDLSLRIMDLVSWMEKYLSAQINVLPAYEERAQEQTLELSQSIEQKKEELKKAAPEDIVRLSEEIVADRDQIAQIEDELKEYQSQASSFKIMVFNTQHVAMPLLKAVSTIQAQGMKVGATDHFLEMELLLK